MEFKHVIEWDYLGHENLKVFDNDSVQSDWNQTLVTSINKLTSDMIKEGSIFTSGKLYVNEKLFNGLIRTLYYYDTEKKTLGRHEVIVINSEEDAIFIDFNSLNKLPMVLLQNETNGEEMKTIKAEMIYNLSDELILQTIKNNYGKIIIKNHE